MDIVKALNLPSPENRLVDTKEDYIAFCKAWKKVVEYDATRDKSNYASLQIFRNIAFGSDIFIGFTPVQNGNKLANGKFFINGWKDAYLHLFHSLVASCNGEINDLSSDIIKLVEVLERKKPNNPKELPVACSLISLVNLFPQPPNKETAEKIKETCERIQKVIIEDTHKKDFVRVKSVNELFDKYEDSISYSFIPVSTSIDEFNALKNKEDILKKFSETVLDVEGNRRLENVVDVQIVDENNSPSIVIKSKKMGKPDPIEYSKPFNHLWETEWMETS